MHSLDVMPCAVSKFDSCITHFQTGKVEMASCDDQRLWEFGDFRYAPRERPLLMGIVNVTPDSFSDGGRFLQSSAAVEHGLRLAEEGADILDVGGESTRPGSGGISVEEELQRVVPVIRQLAERTKIPISVDTSKAAVAREALQAGAVIVNDISGLRFDPQMIAVCRDSTCGVICMHMQGTPQTMQAAPHYEDVVEEICTFFNERLQTLTAAGIAAERIAFDPGVGFGKTAQHNVQILASIRQFQAVGRPILIGHSRKGFLKKVTGRELDERLFGTIGVSVAVAHQGVDLIRVHDVAANLDAITAFLATSK
jgi:dihydropteroate synthase